jgi:predicted XRE-type DNA-binding protein
MNEIERGSTNVYADLGLADPEEMLVKAQLASKIGEIIQLQKLTQTQAAELLGIPQPKLSNMLRGQFRGISETKMIECLTRLGRDVEIVVRTKRSKSAGHVSVVFA